MSTYAETYTIYRRARAVVWIKEEYKVTGTSQSDAQEEFLARYAEGVVEPEGEVLCEDGDLRDYTGEFQLCDANGNIFHEEVTR